MKALVQKRWARAAASVLFILLLLLSAMADVIVGYGRMDNWYRSGKNAGFESTRGCMDYVGGANAYVADNVQWLGDMSLDSLGSYAGPAYAYVIRSESGLVMADTRTENSVPVLANEYLLTPDTSFTVQGYVNIPVEPYGGCYSEYVMFSTFFAYRYGMLALKYIFLLLTGLACWVLCRGAFDRGRRGRLPAVLCLPYDLIILAGIIAYLFSGAVLSYVVDSFMELFSLYTGTWPGLVHAALGDSMAYTAHVTVAALLIWYLSGQLGAGCLKEKLLVRRVIRRIPAWIMIAGITGVHVVLIWLLYNTFRSGALLLLLLVFDLLVCAAMLHFQFQAGQVRSASREICSGNLAYKTDTGKLHFIWRVLGEDLNSIGDGMAQAIEDRIKSERMKTELITNVSHDLKTPLTSIINYVDFLKREDLDPDTRREYLEILDRQSSRLKKLTADVVEASKAASGVISAETEPIDAVELLEQFVGEYAERFEAARLEPVLSVPDSHPILRADSLLLGRVIDNLISNVLKYAQPETRVYLDLLEESNRIFLTVKNISREPLNISADELTERFVRGDSSRHTEGSGLGLSIAQSLTELMGGKMRLFLDGDLFKVELAFAAFDERMQDDRAGAAE